MKKEQGKLYLERRQSPRVSVVLDVTISKYKSKKKISASTGDISKGGVRICSPHGLKPGEKVKVTIALEGKDRIDTEAVVMWAREGGGLTPEIECRYIAGLKFTKLSPTTNSMLSKYIQMMIMG